MIDKVISKTRLATKVYEKAHITGEFKLRSGMVSHEYFDKYLFESDPKLLFSIAYYMKALVASGTEIIAGLEMGGIPIATMISYQMGIPTLFVRKKAKDYGTKKLAEGNKFSGKKVVVVEDVVTSGGQVIESIEALKKQGAQIIKVIAVIDRESGGKENIEKTGTPFASLFMLSDLKSDN